ncbi:hypothetical protein Tco_0031923 [Tanacetum coccineum]
MGCCLTSWFSNKQTALAISTTEAEYVSARKACQQVLWMKQALVEFVINLDDIPVLCDNKSAIGLSKNPVLHSRIKHIEIRHHFLHDNVQKGNISIKKEIFQNIYILHQLVEFFNDVFSPFVSFFYLLCLIKSRIPTEPTLQVELDALKLTSFYKAFEITVDVPEIYMQEFWVTSSRHHSSLRFKMNGKSHTVNVDNFKDMLQICPKLLGQKFEDPPFEEEILSFIRDLGHSSEIKVLSDVNVNHMHQPWRSFAAIINKCLSGKTTALESPRLSRAQILWGMYHNKNVDYVYLLWEDLVYYVENKNSKKNNDMNDPMFTKIRVIFKHQDTQIYGVILPQHLTNQAMLESKAYKTYHAYATGEKIPKTKYVKNKVDPESSPKKKSAQASKGKRIKTSTKAEQIKLATKRSLIQTHSSHASGSGADEGTGVTPGVPDVPSYDSKADQISWKSNDEEDDDKVSMGNDNDDDADNQDDDGQEYGEQDDEEQDDVNEQTDSNNGIFIRYFLDI